MLNVRASLGNVIIMDILIDDLNNLKDFITTSRFFVCGMLVYKVYMSSEYILIINMNLQLCLIKFSVFKIKSVVSFTYDLRFATSGYR